MVMGRPTDRLGIGRTLLFNSTLLRRYVIMKDLHQKPFLYSMMVDLFDQVLETDLGAFDGFIDPLFESKDHVSTGRGCRVLRGVEDLVPVSLEEDASSSKTFLPAIARDSF
ncbi:hypothetical protein Tco_0833293 [Tanacetum coccineum]